MLRLRYNQGDTIVEVLLAFGIFALLAVGATVVMNKGLAVGQQSLERTLVRQQVDSQAELLRYARDAGGSVWSTVTADDKLVVNPSLDSYQECPTAAPADAFVMQVINSGAGKEVGRTALDSSNFEPASYYSRIDITDDGGGMAAEGMWIQAVRVEGPATAGSAYDMYIRACWNSMGASRPLQVSTIVRLYER